VSLLQVVSSNSTESAAASTACATLSLEAAWATTSNENHPFGAIASCAPLGRRVGFPVVVTVVARDATLTLARCEGRAAMPRSARPASSVWAQA
jgi:hypothetical protein